MLQRRPADFNVEERKGDRQTSTAEETKESKWEVRRKVTQKMLGGNKGDSPRRKQR